MGDVGQVEGTLSSSWKPWRALHLASRSCRRLYSSWISCCRCWASLRMELLDTARRAEDSPVGTYWVGAAVLEEGVDGSDCGEGGEGHEGGVD